MYNWYAGISLNIRNLIVVDVKRKLRINIEGVWTFEKYFIGQFERCEYVENIEKHLCKRKEKPYKN